MTSTERKIELIQHAVLQAALHLESASAQKKSIKVSFKSDRSMVMNLDVECQRIMKEALGPALMVVGEEDEESHALITQRGDYVILDPIDGTASCKRYLGIRGGQIGFGPLAGVVESGRLVGAAYFNLPTQIMYTASRGHGTRAVRYEWRNGTLQAIEERTLRVEDPKSILESAILFFPGSHEELRVVLHLRDSNAVENTYRFGAFASDCTRLAENFEQIQLQVRVKAWDFSATLIAVEAGLQAEIDPFNSAVPYDKWHVSDLNPILIAHPSIFPEVKRLLVEALVKPVG